MNKRKRAENDCFTFALLTDNLLFGVLYDLLDTKRYCAMLSTDKRIRQRCMESKLNSHRALPTRTVIVCDRRRFDDDAVITALVVDHMGYAPKHQRISAYMIEEHRLFFRKTCELITEELPRLYLPEIERLRVLRTVEKFPDHDVLRNAINIFSEINFIDQPKESLRERVHLTSDEQEKIRLRRTRQFKRALLHSTEMLGISPGCFDIGRLKEIKDCMRCRNHELPFY